MIVRVLRPAAPTPGSGQQVGGAAPPPDQADAGMETDDMSAVREVRLAYENVKVVDCLDLSPEGNASWEAALKRYSIHVIIICMYSTCNFMLLLKAIKVFGVHVYMYIKVQKAHLLQPIPDLGGSHPSCLLYTSPSPRDATLSRMPSSA